MNRDDFIAGKYGISHGVITALAILIGSLLFGLIGNLAACLIALTSYFIREMRQGDSMDPRDWSADGRYDWFVPAMVVGINMIVVSLWTA